MERAAATTRLRKMLGKGFGYRVNPKAASPEERAEVQAEFPAAAAERDAAAKALDERYRFILANDEQYQTLRARKKEAQERVQKLSGAIYGRKITVGVSNGLFFTIKAEGDSWEEIIAAIQNR